MKKLPEGQKLLPGRFYRAWNHELWCCYKVSGSLPLQSQATCVRVSDNRIEYFYIDGRYDEAGQREHCLIEDISLFWESLQPNYGNKK